MTRSTSTFVLLAMTALAGQSHAQSPDSQSFRLHIPGEISLDTANSNVDITHDLSETNQAFPRQLWVARCRYRNGAQLRFETNQPFTNTTVATAKRDVQLSIERRGSPQWTIGQASDQTDYKSGKNTAFVDAESNRQGRGAFFLSVVFVEETLDTLQAGDYELTVTGTLIPK